MIDPVTLGFWICLQSDIDACRYEKMTAPIDVSVHQCAVQGQGIISHWIQTYDPEGTRVFFDSTKGYQCSQGRES